MRVFSPLVNQARYAVFGIILVLSSVPANAMELLMIEQTFCVICKRFDNEVNYSDTDTAKRLPLRRVRLSDPWPEDLSGIPHDMFTPTFVLVKDGEELGRLRGYPGKEKFWSLLNKLLDANNIQLD